MNIFAYYKFEKLPHSRSAYRMDLVESSSLGSWLGYLKSRSEIREPSYMYIKRYGRTGIEPYIRLEIYDKEGYIESINVSKSNPNYGYCRLSNEISLFCNFKDFGVLNGKPICGSAIECFLTRTRYNSLPILFEHFCRPTKEAALKITKLKDLALRTMVHIPIKTESE